MTTRPTGSTSNDVVTEDDLGRILVIDDENEMRDTISEFLSIAGYDVVAAEGGASGFEKLKEGSFDLVLCDLQMPDVDGLAVLSWMQDQEIDTPVIVMTGHATVDNSIQALRLGAYDFLRKPCSFEIISRTISNCLEKGRLTRLNAELESRNVRLQEVERVKDDLLATVSHEFRTPLTSIRGYLSVFEMRGMDNLRSEQEEAVGAIESSVLRLEGMVENLLVLTECHASTYQPHREPIGATEFLERYLRYAKTTGRRADFEIELASNIDEAQIAIDRSRFPLVLSNLLDNAFKFTDHPESARVLVRARVEDGKLLLEVHDDGVGIPETDATAVFDRFTQADMTSTRSFQGTGLGLAVVREIVSAHHGDIRLVPSLLGGASFRVALPLWKGESDG